MVLTPPATRLCQRGYYSPHPRSMLNATRVSCDPRRRFWCCNQRPDFSAAPRCATCLHRVKSGGANILPRPPRGQSAPPKHQRRGLFTTKSVGRYIFQHNMLNLPPVTVRPLAFHQYRSPRPCWQQSTPVSSKPHVRYRRYRQSAASGNVLLPVAVHSLPTTCFAPGRDVCCGRLSRRS